MAYCQLIASYSMQSPEKLEPGMNDKIEPKTLSEPLIEQEVRTSPKSH
jgi:hypothetical protein